MPHRAVLGPAWVAPREKSPHQPFPDFALLCPRARKRIRRKLAACIILSYKQLGRALGRQTLLCFFALPATIPSRVLGADNDCLPQKRNNMFLFHRIRRNCPFLWCPRKLQPPGLFIAHGRYSYVSLGTSGLKFLNRVWQSLCWHLLGIQGFLNLLLFLVDKGSPPGWGCKMKQREHCRMFTQHHRASSTPVVWCPEGARTARLLGEGAVKAQESCSCWVDGQGELAICWKAISTDRQQSGKSSWV